MTSLLGLAAVAATTALHAHFTNAQVQLPSPHWLPPSPNTGAEPSGSTERPNQHWSTLLGELLYFYDAQRSGTLVNNRIGWRNSSTTDDADGDLSLSGGFYDAGNYLKMTYPLTWVLTSLCWGALDFGQGYDDARQTPYLDSTLRWGLDYLIKAHPESRVLYVQVGDVERENDYWGGDQNIPQPRPAYKIDESHPGTDAAASAASAFAACSLLYSNRTITTGSTASNPANLTNSTYAATLLEHATQLFDFAANAPGDKTEYSNSVPEAADAYESHSFGDDLALAALWLGFATNSTSTLQQVRQFWDEYNLDEGDETLDWDSKSPAIPVLFSQILTAHSDLGSAEELAFWKEQAESNLDSVVAADGPGHLTAGGLLWYDGTSDSVSLNAPLNAAMLLVRYASLATTEEKKNEYLSFAKLQLEYVLGNNPMQVPYVVGLNPNSPRNPHSGAASGGNDIGHIDDRPVDSAHILYGAVVGGPDHDDKFWDTRSDWVQTEVALDYNAPLLTLAAWKVFTDGNDPYYVRLKDGAYQSRRPEGTRPCADPNAMCRERGEFKLSRGGQIAVGVVIGLAGAIIVGLLGYYAFTWWKNRTGSLDRGRTAVPRKA